MATTKYSHAFFVGSYNGEFNPEQLDDNSWKIERISANGEYKRYSEDWGYNGLCSIYYKGHLDSMIKADGQGNVPEFVQPVAHYICDRATEKRKKIRINYNKWDGTLIEQNNYQLDIVRLHIFIFPLNTIIYAIEIDDTGSDLNELTMSHFLLLTWAWDKGANTLADDTKSELSSALQPLDGVAFNNTCAILKNEGNKLKSFQCIKVSEEFMNDETLYEIGTSSPIGCVKKNEFLTPSESYFKNIMDENSVSAFKNWKGLALMDTFTMLGLEKSFKEDDANFVYFPLIYIRCLFEKSFCFTRNSAYRRGENSEDIEKDISNMERYYFYDSISYNFLPNLVYKAMAKGLGIKGEREEITQQIKDRAKVDRETRLKKENDKKEIIENKRNLIGFILAFFAIFSVAWDLCSMFTTAASVPEGESNTKAVFAIVFIALAIVVITALFIFYKVRYDDSK